MSRTMELARDAAANAASPTEDREHTAAVEPTAAVRLRRGVSSRNLPGRGVAISAGSTAVVINGGTAEKLWQYLEPSLRAGTTAAALGNGLPEAAAAVVRGLMEELDAHDLLCFVEAPAVPGENLPGLAHFEKSAKYPVAAARRVGTTELLLTASDHLLLDECRTALEEAGFSRIEANLASTTSADPLLVPPAGWRMAVLHASGATGVEPLAIALEAGGWRVVGPTNGRLDTGQWPLLRAWAQQQVAAGATRHPAVSLLGDKLAAAQLTLAAMAAMEPNRMDAAFMVTNPDIVSEPHPLFHLEPLEARHGAESSARLWDNRMLAMAADSPQPDPADALPGYEKLWQGRLNPWNGPDPGDLRQLPLGAAQAGLAGTRTPEITDIGMSTASARINCLESLATRWAGPVGAGRTRRVGHTAQAAVAASAMWALDGRSDWATEPAAEPGTQFTARARRLWSGLALRLGIDGTLLTETWRQGREPLFRVTVVDPASRILGRGMAPRLDLATEEALIRAVGTGQIAAEDTATDLAAPVALGLELLETRRSMARWVADNGRQLGMVLSTPAHAEQWSRAGLHVVDIGWEQRQ